MNVIYHQGPSGQILSIFGYTPTSAWLVTNVDNERKVKIYVDRDSGEVVLKIGREIYSPGYGEVDIEDVEESMAIVDPGLAERLYNIILRLSAYNAVLSQDIAKIAEDLADRILMREMTPPSPQTALPRGEVGELRRLVKMLRDVIENYSEGKRRKAMEILDKIEQILQALT